MNLPPAFFAVCVALLSVGGAFYAYRKVLKARRNAKIGLVQIHGAIGKKFAGHIYRSRPIYFALYAALWVAVPACSFAAIWLMGQTPILHELMLLSLPDNYRNLSNSEQLLFLSQILNHNDGVMASTNNVVIEAASRLRHYQTQAFVLGGLGTLVLAFCGLGYGLSQIKPKLIARESVETAIKILMLGAAMVAVATTLGIFLSLVIEAVRFFRLIPLSEFLFGLEWSPQIALRADQVASAGSFGAIPIFVGSLLIMVLALMVAGPLGLLTAIYLSQYANPIFRALVKPMLEILAGVPTVVYGFFAALVVAPLIRDFGLMVGLSVASESALAAGLVMGVMIIPFVCSLSEDVISAVPQALKEASLGLGATQAETIQQVILPAALPGIIGALLLAVSRAIGETMIVVMAAGLTANLTINPLQAVTTVTVQIVTLLVGDQAFDSPKTLAAFALGLVLFILTLLLNFVAQLVVKRYREQYE